MCFCEDNPPKVMHEETRKAARDHVCYECGGTIAKGDLYRITSGIWDGGPASFKWCHDCATIANLVEGIDRDIAREARSKPHAWPDYLYEEGFCFTFGSLLECANEYINAIEPRTG